MLLENKSLNFQSTLKACEGKKKRKHPKLSSSVAVLKSQNVESHELCIYFWDFGVSASIPSMSQWGPVNAVENVSSLHFSLLGLMPSLHLVIPLPNTGHLSPVLSCHLLSAPITQCLQQFPKFVLCSYSKLTKLVQSRTILIKLADYSSLMIVI